MLKKITGSVRVGSGQEVFKISRVESGWVWSSRVKGFKYHGSGQEAFKSSRVGSGHDPR